MLDTGVCVANPLECAHNIATGHTLSDSYTHWLSSHGVQTGPNSQYGAGIGTGLSVTMMLGIFAGGGAGAAADTSGATAADAGDASSIAVNTSRDLGVDPATGGRSGRASVIQRFESNRSAVSCSRDPVTQA